MAKRFQNQTEELIDTLRSGITPALNTLAKSIDSSNSSMVTSLDSTELAGHVIEAVGIPAYVSDVSVYSDYGITETGWYVFARITGNGEKVGSGTTVTGAAGYIATVGSDHIDVAVRFEVAAESKAVTVHWKDGVEFQFIFKATDLAIRNLDYRVTFYVYDISPYTTWEYALTTDTTIVADKVYYEEQDDEYILSDINPMTYALTEDVVFQAGKTYYTLAEGVYTPAEVQTVAYVLTEDETFQDGKTYYTLVDGVYTAATVTTGEAVTADTYYEQTTVPVPANTYYEASATVVPAFYKDQYTLTADETFQAGKTYYTLSEGTYTAATVTEGEAVTPETYYEHSYVQATGTFEAGVTYYTHSGDTYTEATVTTGDAIPALYNHSKVIFSGMERNVTYQLDEIIDCPQEYVLPEIEDDGHGAWFEIRLRHSGSYSSTLIVPEGVKIATEHTQAETAGMNMVDLHYMSIDGIKIWRFMNTHSSIPTT